MLSQWEDDPSRPIEAKLVLAVFSRVGRVLHLHAGGQVIRTTPEHPFWVMRHDDTASPGRESGEWQAAGAMQPGDRLLSHDGTAIEVGECMCGVRQVGNLPPPWPGATYPNRTFEHASLAQRNILGR